MAGKRLYDKLDKIIHGIKFTLGNIHKERNRNDKEMKDHLDELVECMQDLYGVVEEIGERNNVDIDRRSGKKHKV